MRGFVGLILGVTVALSPACPDPPPRARTVVDPAVLPRTPSERCEFRCTPRYDETLEYLRDLASRWSAVRLETFGTTAAGRPMTVAIVSTGGSFTPESARSDARAVVMIQNGIHAGEIDGKDACLMLLRDWATGATPAPPATVVVLVVPVYNVDGHERVSPWNRANQNGPAEGMGFRTTANGLDLNRDHLKIESVEARRLIGLFNAWRPHLHVDGHVTDGADHDWVLTYSWAEAPQAPPSVDLWLREHMPRVIDATRRAGHPAGPYVDLIDRNDPAAGFESWVGGPRYATGYYPLRNRPSILIENHAYKPYGDRVRANRDFLRALLEEIAREPGALVKAVEDAERRVVALGRPDAEPSDVVLEWERSGEPDRIRYPTYAWKEEPSVVFGGTLIHYRTGEVREIEVDWHHRVRPRSTIRRPRGYVVLPGWPEIEERIVGHGLHFERFGEERTMRVETLSVSNAEYADRPYQGLVRVSAGVESSRETRQIPAGALWIPADQPDFEVAVQSLEPAAPDSLFAWGLLSRVMERKEYIEPRNLEQWARERLADPEVRRLWQAALENEAFAADGRARYEWWFRRTPWWDDTVGLLPVLRVVETGETEGLGVR